MRKQVDEQCRQVDSEKIMNFFGGKKETRKEERRGNEQMFGLMLKKFYEIFSVAQNEIENSLKNMEFRNLTLRLGRHKE